MPGYRYVRKEPSTIKSVRQCKPTDKCTVVKAPVNNFGPPGPDGIQGPDGSSGNLNKCLPPRSGSSVFEPGDLVALGKGGKEAQIRKVLCEQWEWAAAVNNNSNNQHTNETFPSVATDSCGNIYVVGLSTGAGKVQYYDAMLNGNTSPTSRLSDSGIPNTQGGTLIFVGKITPVGVWEWTATVGRVDNIITGTQGAPTIAVDSCGNVYITGVYTTQVAPIFYDALANGNTSPVASTITPFTQPTEDDTTSIFVSKLSPQGVWQWVAAVNANKANNLNPIITVTNCDNIYVAGRGSSKDNPVTDPLLYYGALSNGDTSMTSQLTGLTSQSSQIFVAKIKPSGQWEWSAAIDSISSDSLPAITADSCGNVYVAGITNTVAPSYFNADPLTGDTLLGSSITGKTGTNRHIYVGKLDCGGQWNWSADVDSDTIDWFPAIAADHKGNVYVAGTTGATTNLNFYDGTTNLPSITGKPTNDGQVFIGKLRNSGKWEWVASVDGDDLDIGLSFVDEPPSIAVDACGNVLVTGTRVVTNQPILDKTLKFYKGVTDGSVDPNPLCGLPLVLYTTQTFLGKLTPEGEWMWATGVNNDNTVSFPKVASDSCGNVYLAGQASITPPLFHDAGANGNTLTDYSIMGIPSKSTHVYVAKLANDALSARALGVIREGRCNTNTNSCYDPCNPRPASQYAVDLFGLSNAFYGLSPGCTYYLDCSRDREAYADTPFCPSITTQPCSPCGCPNRGLGTAIDSSTMVLKIGPPVCKKKRCCSCKSNPLYVSTPP